MSAARPVLLARAASIRADAAHHTGLVRDRMIAHAEGIERRILGDARLTGEPIDTVRTVAGEPAIRSL